MTRNLTQIYHFSNLFWIRHFFSHKGARLIIAQEVHGQNFLQKPSNLSSSTSILPLYAHELWELVTSPIIPLNPATSRRFRAGSSSHANGNNFFFNRIVNSYPLTNEPLLLFLKPPGAVFNFWKSDQKSQNNNFPMIGKRYIRAILPAARKLFRDLSMQQT